MFGLLFNSEKFWKNKIGMTTDRVSTHSYSDIGSTYRPMTAYERSKIQASVQNTYNEFVSVVQEGRKFPNYNEAHEISQGRVWSGLRARSIKLVDEMDSTQHQFQQSASCSGTECCSLPPAWLHNP